MLRLSKKVQLSILKKISYIFPLNFYIKILQSVGGGQPLIDPNFLFSNFTQHFCIVQNSKKIENLKHPRGGGLTFKNAWGETGIGEEWEIFDLS